MFGFGVRRYSGSWKYGDHVFVCCCVGGDILFFSGRADEMTRSRALPRRRTEREREREAAPSNATSASQTSAASLGINNRI